MRLAHRIFAASLLAATSTGTVAAQTSTIETVSFGHRRATLGFVPSQPGCLPGTPTDPTQPNPLTQPPNFIDPGAQASLAGTGGGGATAMPQSIGDLGSSYRALRPVTVPTFTTITRTVQKLDISNLPVGPPVTTTTTRTDNTVINIYEAIASRTGSGYKIGENESPRPLDLVFFTYHGYYNSGIAGVGGSSSTQTAAPDFLRGQSITNTSTTTQTFGVPNRTFDVHRELFGFEKTFLDGNASIGIRLPIFQTNGGDFNGGFAGNAFGDMSVILKYALLNDPETNNVFSVGLALGLPTGPAIQTVEGNINSVLWQPFVGFIVNRGDAYVQGFSAVVVPTNQHDAVLMFNDVSVGYFLTRNDNPGAFFNAVVPTLEVHVSTPLNSRGVGGAVQAFDIVSFTGGVHLGMGERAWLTLGLNVPITGPRPYEIEGVCQLSYRY